MKAGIATGANTKRSKDNSMIGQERLAKKNKTPKKTERSDKVS